MLGASRLISLTGQTMNKYNLLGNYLQPLGSLCDNAFLNNDRLLQRSVIAALFRRITDGKTVYSIINICTAVPFWIIAYTRFCRRSVLAGAFGL